MGTRTRVVTAALLAVGTAALLPPGTGLADPKGDLFVLTCGSATYSVTTPPGDGEWTPAFDLDSNRVFIPVSFGTFTGTITGPDGASTTFTEPPADKGSGKQRATVSCTYAFSDVFDLTAEEAEAEGFEGGAGTYVFEGGGTVTGQVRGH